MREYKGLIFARLGPGRCGFCNREGARFVDIHFESHTCSLKCAEALWREYLEAERRIEQRNK